MNEKLKFIKLSAGWHFTQLIKWICIDQKEAFNVEYRGILIKNFFDIFLSY